MLIIIKIKLTWPYYEHPLERQTSESSGIWGNCKFYINKNIKAADYWIVYNQIPLEESVYCPPENTIIILGEPATVQKYDEKFLSQFATVVTCQRGIHHKNIKFYLQGQPWLVNKNYDELHRLEHVEKLRDLSIITSDKQFTVGHKKRYEFALNIKNYFGDKVDLFGRGIRPFNDKWDILAPYKYSIAIENSAFDDYITEKIYDCFLAHTFPFYHGSKNITDYFKIESFEIIDINNFDKTVSIIERTIKDKSHYANHLKFLIEAKNMYLNYYNFFPLIVNYIKRENNTVIKTKKYVTIYPEAKFKSLFGMNIERLKRMTCIK